MEDRSMRYKLDNMESGERTGPRRIKNRVRIGEEGGENRSI